MQNDNYDFGLQLSATPCLNNLDTALHRLGMLAAPSDSRREYLDEIRKKPYLNMVKINTRYVSNVSVGFRVRPVLSHVRYSPYSTAGRLRHRTKSENNDTGDGCFDVGLKDIGEGCANSVDDVTNQLKKAKSLESIAAETGCAIKTPHFVPELDVVSSCIKNLKVD